MFSSAFCDISDDSNDAEDDKSWDSAANAAVELIISMQHQQTDLVAEFFLSCLEVALIIFEIR